MNLSRVERTLKSDKYTCDIYSFRGVYGFVVYSEYISVKELISLDFGYYGMELAESAALACVLRHALGVSVKDYDTAVDDSESDCDSEA